MGKQRETYNIEYWHLSEDKEGEISCSSVQRRNEDGPGREWGRWGSCAAPGERREDEARRKGRTWQGGRWGGTNTQGWDFQLGGDQHVQVAFAA